MYTTTSNTHDHASILKIGFDAKRAFNNHSGLGNYARFVIGGLIKMYPQHQFYLFTPSIKPEFENIFAHHINVHLITPKSFLGKTFKALWRTYSVVTLLNKLGVNVYHGLSNELPADIKKFNGKSIVTIHDLIFLRYPNYYKKIDREIYNRKFLKACKNASFVVAASKQTAHDIEHFYHTSPPKIKVVYQNCHAQFETKLTQEAIKNTSTKYNLPDNYIVCIGTIEERKQQLMVLQAFHQSNVNCNLVFVGKQTPFVIVLKNYIHQHQLSNKVQFIEGASFSDFPAFYQGACLAVYASEFEGFGIPVLESLRSGVKVAVANTSSLTEVGGNAVHYFENAAQLTQLFNNINNLKVDELEINLQLKKFKTETLLHQLMDLYTN